MTSARFDALPQVDLACNGRRLGVVVHLAETFGARLRGLLGQSGLLPGIGLGIAPCSSVHGVGMRFEVEVWFLDDRGVVLGVRALAPWRVAGRRGARSVIEWAPGEARRLRVAVGDRLLQLPPRMPA
jgi:uncharacterized membrane protein (UPF0127 family)